MSETQSGLPKPANSTGTQPRSSRQRYRGFVQDYQQRRLDDLEESDENQRRSDDPAKAGEDASPPKSRSLLRGKRREYLRDYLRWLRPHRYGIVAVFGFALLVAGLEMIEPLFMRFIIDRVLLNTELDTASRLSRVHLAGAIFLAVIILANLIGALKDYRQRLLNVRVMLSLRRALFDRLLHLPLPKVWDMKTGGILSRLTGDIETTTGLLQMALVSPAISIIRLVIAVGVLFALNWRLAITALAIIPGAMFASFVFARRIRPIYRSVRKDVEQIDGRVGETFSGIRVVRAFRRELRELRDYMAGRHTVLRKEMFAHRRELILWTSWGLLVSGVNVVIIWFGGSLNVLGRASIGDIMAFQWYTFLLLNPVWNIVNSFSELQRSLAAMERVFEVLAMPPDKPDRPDACDAPSVVHELRFENVTFEYNEGRPVVHDFSVAAPGGSVVALVGRSGAGKTTVTDLVARFHDPTRGCILLNGSDIRDFRLGTYRDLLAIVQQDVFLFDGSVRDNIAYGRHDATDAEVEDAARRANAHEFIAKLPGQYGTTIGERGVKLSGGQQQRLAIARAILASPQILILDEATSNLDTESEQLIQASMAELLAGRTTFVIAHRLSTIRRADLILLMEEGRVTERGTHEELMAARGAYHGMVLRQMESHRQDGDEVWR
ncbi:MAG: ATP-binding cassette subfamily B bacterial MsbA [Limisphaerales bacterium]|nr:MAG: ATP-binding cassette subfamily B bacterial MsbA [Limisphaerales bacterium]KAG0508394.1 MAG: ATP-binding cassette subfamily B bacterial MsbA [Limisphaerales bacterium]TXT49902.1 MAG: ATP-binding cassette subfamily B bacterial MsbA [Limisphaerales bacterium]